MVKLLDVRLVKLLLKNNKLWHLIRVPEDLESKEVSVEKSPELIPDHVCQFSKVILAFYAQLVDDLKGQTLAQASSKELGAKANTNVSVSKEVGKKLAERAVANGVSAVVFDRNGYLYHGNVKALADCAREGGLKF